MLFRKSMQIAQRLGVKGVVFHAGLLSGLNLRLFADRWIEKSKGFLRTLAGEFPNIDIYIENTFEQEPYLFEALSKELADVKNIGLCLDYAHASLTKTPAAKWPEALAPYIRHIHINDNDLQSDLHLAVGDGKIDFAEFMYLVVKFNIDASVLVEVSSTDIKQLSKDEEYFFTLGVEKREVCVMFVDIRGFTPMSEKLSPEEVAQILNEFLSEVTNCVFRHSGMLDKFIGDAAMSVFNAPTDLADYLIKAVCAAVDIRNCGETLGKRLRERYGNTVNFGIGLNCGDAVVGNIGCEIRMDYTAIGDTVNTAARLEAKASGGEILISEELYERLKDRIDAQFKGEITLKGKELPVKVYSVLDVKEDTISQRICCNSASEMV